MLMCTGTLAQNQEHEKDGQHPTLFCHVVFLIDLGRHSIFGEETYPRFMYANKVVQAKVLFGVN